MGHGCMSQSSMIRCRPTVVGDGVLTETLPLLIDGLCRLFTENCTGYGEPVLSGSLLMSVRNVVSYLAVSGGVRTSDPNSLGTREVARPLNSAPKDIGTAAKTTRMVILHSGTTTLIANEPE
jgi:hypothetical protein